MDSSQVKPVVKSVAPNKEDLIYLDSVKVINSTKCTEMQNSIECCSDACGNDAKKEEVCSASEELNHSPLHGNATQQLHQSGIQTHSQTFTVKVKQLSGKVTKNELKRIFSCCGKVHSIRINEVPEPYNYAYVNYTSPEAANKAVKKLNGKKLYGTGIRVILHNSSATKVHRKPNVDSCGSMKTGQLNIKVEHIPSWITNDMLQSVFLSRGYSPNVQLLETLETSHLFNHAIVTFDHFEDALRAVEELSEKVIQIDHRDFQLFLNIDGSSSKHRKLNHTYTLPQKSLEEAKLHTGNDSNTEEDNTFTAPVTSPNVTRAVCDEGISFTKQFQCAALKDGNGILSQCNSIATTEVTQQACDSDVLPLNITGTTSDKVIPSCETKEERSVPCMPLLAKILFAHCADVIKKLQNTVSIRPNASYSALLLSGTAANLTLAENELNEIIRNMQTFVTKQIFPLPCHYLLLLSSSLLKKKLSKIEAKHAVCINIANENNRTFSVEQCFRKMRFMILKQKDAVEAKELSIFLNGHVPAVQCIGAQCHTWSWENDFMGYTKYPPDICEELTKQFLKSNQALFTLMIGSKTYTINLASMKQINALTGYERTIQHEAKHIDLCDINPERCKHKPSYRLCIQLEGHERYLDSAIRDLKCCMEEFITESRVKVNMKNSAILNLTDSYCIETQIMEDDLVLRGAGEYVSKVIIQVQNACIAHLKSTSSTFSRPSHWVNQSEKVSICPVGNATSEWNEVAALLHKTLPNATMLTLVRIQNEWLWKRYSFAKQRIIDKNGEERLNERKLFHGTKSITPDVIYQSEQGFDFRCSSETNMWGAGTYFAVNASYSDSYSHLLATHTKDKQMFLADVLTGVAYKCQPDSTLKRPPQNHDSVTGYTNGSDIFVIYDLDQSYPAYLITYRNT